MTKGWRPPAHIDDHVDKRPSLTTDKFALGKGHGLKMQASYRPGVPTKRLIFLNEFDVDNILVEPVLSEKFAKISTIIFPLLWNKLDHSGYRQCLANHSRMPL